MQVYAQQTSKRWLSGIVCHLYEDQVIRSGERRASPQSHDLGCRRFGSLKKDHHRREYYLIDGRIRS